MARVEAGALRLRVEAVPDHFLWARRAPDKVIDGVEAWLTGRGL